MSSDSLASLLVEILSAATNREPASITPDSSLIDLGFDSLGLTALVTRIEAEFSCSFSSEQILEFFLAELVSDLQAQIEHAMRTSPADA